MLRGNFREIFGKFTNKLFQISSVCILYNFLFYVILILGKTENAIFVGGGVATSPLF